MRQTEYPKEPFGLKCCKKNNSFRKPRFSNHFKSSKPNRYFCFAVEPFKGRNTEIKKKSFCNTSKMLKKFV